MIYSTITLRNRLVIGILLHQNAGALKKSASNIIDCICFDLFFVILLFRQAQQVCKRLETAYAVILRALRRLGFRKTPVGISAFEWFAPPHFFTPVKILRIFPHRAQKNFSYRGTTYRRK